MAEAYNVKYYTMDLIPEYRDDYIWIRLRWFIEHLALERTDWPLNCFKLLKRVKALKNINFEYNYIDMPRKTDAITVYIPEHDLYIMHLNVRKLHYPFKCSKDRRLTFTVAHELSHIVLGHLNVPRSAKPKWEIALEEIEADEFAGRLLMPESILFSCNYYSPEATASYLNVSDTALWKRLNNLKRLDLLCSRKVHSCSNCGNSEFSVFAEFCERCGSPLKGGGC